MKKSSNEEAKSLARVSARNSIVASLNDKCRKTQNPDNTYLCLSLIQRGDEFMKQALSQIADVSIPLAEEETDEEKGYGSTSVEGTKLSWSIDYFDLDEEDDSPDPADPKVTVRTMSVWIG